VATLASLSQTCHEPEHNPSQEYLDIALDLLSYGQGPAEGDSEPLMMAQPVPHQSTDRKRVKVYELRNNDWFDRGTGFCTAAFMDVCLAPSPFLAPSDGRQHEKICSRQVLNPFLQAFRECALLNQL
jgi:protein phosphatase-4 regulatory subunit 3